MRIGIVCYPTFGGSGVLATELGIALSQKGHQIHFISYKRPARLNNFYKDVFFHEVNAAQYPLFETPPYDTALTSKIVDVALHENLDILHVHYAIPHATVAFLAKQILKTKGKSLPVVTTLHGTDITLIGHDKSMSPVVEFSINESDVITTVSDSLRKQTIEYFNTKKKIDVIYNFIDLERFKRRENIEFKKAIAPNGEKVITHTSNFRKVKRVKDVIQTFKIIRDSIAAKLVLVGDGPERRNCEATCRQLGVCNDIHFLGKQDAVEEILSIGDLFLLPSKQESFGLAALEALACNVPVISTNVGGLPEVNVDGETGFLCDVGDTHTMAQKGLLILEDEKLLNTFKENARKKAIQFSKSNIVPQYEHLYENCMTTTA